MTTEIVKLGGMLIWKLEVNNSPGREFKALPAMARKIQDAEIANGNETRLFLLYRAGRVPGNSSEGNT